MVRHAASEDLDTRLLIAALLEAMVIMQTLEGRASARGDRRRARALAKVAPRPNCRVSDSEIGAALEGAGGSIRAAARALGIAPSTISRRRVACRDGAQHSPQLLSAKRHPA